MVKSGEVLVVLRVECKAVAHRRVGDPRVVGGQRRGEEIEALHCRAKALANVFVAVALDKGQEEGAIDEDTAGRSGEDGFKVVGAVVEVGVELRARPVVGARLQRYVQLATGGVGVRGGGAGGVLRARGRVGRSGGRGRRVCWRQRGRGGCSVLKE